MTGEKKCYCTEDYSGDYCEIYTPCKNVECYNDGVCEDGECQCLNGYFGNRCEQRKDPNQIKVNVNFSFQNPSGNEWDYNTISPDIYVVIKKGTEIVYLSSTIENANFLNSHTFSSGVVFDDATATYTVEVWDEDTGIDGDTQDDFMGSKNAVFFPINGEVNDYYEFTWNSGSSNTANFQILFNYGWDY